MCRHDRSDVHDEPLLRRCVSDVRRGRDPVSGERPGRPSGPNDLHISQDDQMHFPQIRRVWRGGDARLNMHTAAKRRQRKDIRLPVVLVHDPRLLVGGRDRLQVLVIGIRADRLYNVYRRNGFILCYLPILRGKNIDSPSWLFLAR